MQRLQRFPRVSATNGAVINATTTTAANATTAAYARRAASSVI
jgi:hypothetical protein